MRDLTAPQTTAFSSNFRKVSARLKTRAEKLLWTRDALDEQISGVTATFSNVSTAYSTGLGKFVRYGIKTGTAQIYTCALTPAKTYASAAWTSYAAFPAGGTDTRYIAVSSDGNSVLCADAGKVYRRSGSSWVLIVDLTADGIIPYITITHLGDGYNQYAVAAVYTQTSGVNDHCDIWFMTGSGGTNKWEGYIPQVKTKVNLAGVYYQSYAYIYVDDGSGKHPVQLKRYYEGSWSASRQILPTGMEDDDNAFTVGHAGMLNGFPYLTGVIRRLNGGVYSVILSGPEDFSIGRDMIIGISDSRRYAMREISGVIYALADGYSAWADNQGPFQSPTADSANIPADYATKKIPSFQMQTVLNQPDRLTFQLDPSQIENTDLGVNSSVYVEVTANDEPYILGRFGVDRVRKEEIDSGNVYSLDCTSWALKKLMDWQSDSYLDYLGQSETHGDPSDLAKLARAQGKFDKGASGGAVMTEFNQDGILYTLPSASHGGWMTCRFANIPYVSQDVIVGVGLNYGQETLSAAATRLKKKLADVKSTDRMTFGIFAVYVPYWKATGAGRLCLYSYNTARIDGRDHPWLLLADVAYVVAGTDHWIALNYQDGYARVYADATNGDPTYDLMISTPVRFRDTQPTEHINYGRGAVFMRLDTGFQAALPFGADSDVVPFYTETEEGLAYDLPMTGICNWKFPTSNGTVLVDSEQIKYTGIAGFEADGVTPRSTQDLWVIPGKVVAKSVGTPLPAPTGAQVIFASAKTNNKLVQNFTVPATCLVNAVRLWVQKINYPEDGLEVMITQGNTIISSPQDKAHPYGTSISVGNYVNSAQIKAAGGYVICYLTTPITLKAGVAYRLVLQRGKNPSHPDSTTYFATKALNATPGQGFYRFSDDEYKTFPGYGYCEDMLFAQNGVLPFQIFAKLEADNKEYAVAVQYETGKGLPTTVQAETFHANMAFCGMAGGGKGVTLKIVRSRRFTDSLNDIYIFDLEKDPGRIWDGESKARATLAFHGLTRGYSGTLAASHGNLVKIHRYAATALTCTAAYFEHFSANEDLTLAEVAREIARKAQVPEVIIADRYIGTPAWLDYHGAGLGYWPEVANKGTNNLIAIATLNDTLNAGQRIIFSFFNRAIDDDVVEVCLDKTALGATTLNIASIADGQTSQTHDYNVNTQLPIAGEIRVELFSGWVSVWIGGRLVGACVTDNTFKDANHTWDLFTVKTIDYNAPKLGSPPIKVSVPEAGTRVDSFVMDQGKTGLQLLTSLIGEKRIYYREDRWGRLKIFTERPVLSTPIYNRAIAVATETSDQGLATRILVEGAETVEVSSAGNLYAYGNLFKTVNFNEINNLEDARYFANMVLGDMQLNLKPLTFQGPADPLYEPGDKMNVYSRGGAKRSIVVDSIAYEMHTDQAEAVLDMQVTGRETATF